MACCLDSVARAPLSRVCLDRSLKANASAPVAHYGQQWIKGHASAKHGLSDQPAFKRRLAKKDRLERERQVKFIGLAHILGQL